MIKKDSALVIVDMLYDFIDGSMACLNAGPAVEATQHFIDHLPVTEGSEDSIFAQYPILFVCDHHPADHCSFTAQGGPWPSHCVQGSHGAEIHASLADYARSEFVFYKGCRQDQEQYSGFEGVNEAGQSLAEVLRLLDIKNVYVSGIATEFCVLNTCMDLKKAGFTVYLLQDSIAYVSYEGHLQALNQMSKDGIRLIGKA